MNGNRILLDTNCVIAVLAGEQPAIDVVASAAECAVPVIVLGELIFGAYSSTLVSENLEKIKRLSAAKSVLACDTESAAHYGRIKSQLKSLGRMIPENDVWIAAIATQHGLTVATRDQHFAAVEGLACIDW